MLRHSVGVHCCIEVFISAMKSSDVLQIFDANDIKARPSFTPLSQATEYIYIYYIYIYIYI
jgi:hypothetical protein